MTDRHDHLSDQTLLLAADGELSTAAQARVAAHVAACWTCRTRRQEIETAVGEFMREYRRTLDPSLPSAEGPRALLKLRLKQLAQERRGPRFAGPLKLSWAAAVVAGMAIALYLFAPGFARDTQSAMLSVPDRSLTPGATVFLSREDVCRAPNGGNKAAPAALKRKVFEEYGIRRPRPHTYEVDYLITPALGGADDIHNLWPQSYGAVWNARVKDVLEDHLRDMVCAGQLDLTTAQRDIAINWINAYKKYFHTERPLPVLYR
jgi:hypothetical protein